MPSSNAEGALQGVRILDLTRVLSGPYCTQILADHGADVLKVEPPSGDETRTWGPPFVDDVASYFRGVNRNKRSMCLDIASPAGKERVLQLLEEADVLIENFKAGTMARWGLDHVDLSDRFPKLVYCSISGFGADGPLGGLPGYDAAIQAMSGIMSVNGVVGGNATRVGIPIVDIVTGLNATIGILMALQERERSGREQQGEIPPQNFAVGGVMKQPPVDIWEHDVHAADRSVLTPVRMPRGTVRRVVADRVGFRGEYFTSVMNWLTPGMGPGTVQPRLRAGGNHPAGGVRFHVGDKVCDAGPGAAIRIPAGVLHYAELMGDEVALNLDIFAPPRGDYAHL
ncbi:CoA transferase [Variovorax paradoxus]|nr:CoA transferase [Variovorax paradoxus]MBT2305110.1 CoA transferase [Variovorax paradoxus]